MATGGLGVKGKEMTKEEEELLNALKLVGIDPSKYKEGDMEKLVK